MRQCQFSSDSGKRKYDPHKTVMEQHEKGIKLRTIESAVFSTFLVSEPTLLNF